jgi:hypothetical protein
MAYSKYNSSISIYSLPLTSTGRSLAYIYKPKACYSVLVYKSLLLVINERTIRRQRGTCVSFGSAVSTTAENKCPVLIAYIRSGIVDEEEVICGNCS